MFCKVACVRLSFLNVTVLYVTEIWLETDRAPALSLPTYTLMSCCWDGSKGGGVGFFVEGYVFVDIVEVKR